MNYRIRPGQRGDAEEINRIVNWYICNTHISFDTIPWDLPTRQKWLLQFDSLFLRENSASENTGQLHFLYVAESAGRLLGYTCNTMFRPKAAYRHSTECTVYVDHMNSIPGVGSALYRQLFDRLSETDLHRAYAVISQPNDRSNKLHERFGFVRQADLTECGYKFGRFMDIAVYQKALD
ncbi:MAG: N-acetyltransferase family protein [Pseudomonadota bacterium]